MGTEAPEAGLSERLIREMLRTPPVKELILNNPTDKKKTLCPARVEGVQKRHLITLKTAMKRLGYTGGEPTLH